MQVLLQGMRMLMRIPCVKVAENYAHEFMMLGYSSKKVLSLYSLVPHFKSANAVYNILRT